jgi:hypothetical protein
MGRSECGQVGAFRDKDSHPPLLNVSESKLVWRRSDRAANLARNTATLLRESAPRFAWGYTLALLLQEADGLLGQFCLAHKSTFLYLATRSI